MSSDIASLAPLGPTVIGRRPDPADIVPPDAGEISFRELWTDKEGGFSFADALDIINPLQHLPVIGTLYRAITGDQIGLGARIAGGALFGGPLGVLGAATMAAADQAAGGEPGRQLIAFVQDMFGGGGDTTSVADAAGPRALAAIAPAAGAADKATAAVPDAATARIAAATESSAPAMPVAFQTGGREFPAFPKPAPVARGAVAPLRPGLRNEPALPTIPGRAASAGAQSAAPRTDAQPADAERKRIAAAIDEAQRAQAGLLLASIAGAPVSLPQTESGTAEGTAPAGDAADPFRNHPLAPPPGASPAWYGKAMERALDRYQQTQRLPRGADVPPPGRQPSGRTPLPVE